MKRRIVIFNSILLFFSIVILSTYTISIINDNKKSSYNQLEEYSLLATNYFDGTNHQETIDYFKLVNNIKVSIFNSNYEQIYQTDVDESKETPELNDLGNIYSRNVSGKDMIYLAVEDDGYFIRVAIPKMSVDIVYYVQIVAFVFFILILSVIVSLYLINKLKPINNIVKKLNAITGEAFSEDKIYDNIDLIETKIETKIIDLEKQKLRVESILKSFVEGIVVIDNNKNIVVINSKAQSIFNLNDTVINNSYFSLLKSNELIENITESMDSKKNIKLIVEIDNQIFNTNIIHLKNDYLSGIMVTLDDITIEYNMAQIKKDFFQNASHELKSPLTSILGYQQLIKEGIYETKEDILDGVTSTIKQANKMNKLIIDMLELSQLESDFKEEVTSINLKLVIIEVLDSLSLFIKKRNINLVLSIDDCFKEINLKHATELFTNLIENGIKYNKENSNLEITLNKDVFIVKDNGIGIELKNKDRIFERFYRVSSNNQIRGNGLGLAIVKHIVNLYNYEIQVDSVLSSYTEFKIIF